MSDVEDEGLQKLNMLHFVEERQNVVQKTADLIVMGKSVDGELHAMSTGRAQIATDGLNGEKDLHQLIVSEADFQ